MEKSIKFIFLVALCCILGTGCITNINPAQNAASVSKLSIPQKLYWLERLSKSENMEETTYLVEFDMENHEYKHFDFAEDSRYWYGLETVPTNHPGGVVVAEYPDEEGVYSFYAFDENDMWIRQYTGRVENMSGIDGLYDGIIYYCDGSRFYQRNLRSGLEERYPSEGGVGTGGICVSPNGRVFDTRIRYSNNADSQEKDDLRNSIIKGEGSESQPYISLGVFSAEGGKWMDFRLPQEVDEICWNAVWKDEDTVLLVLESELDDGIRESKLYTYSISDNCLEVYRDIQNREIVLYQGPFSDRVMANSLQLDCDGKYISYVLRASRLTIAYEQNMDIVIQSLETGEQYLVRSIRSEDGSYKGETFTKAIWVSK